MAAKLANLAKMRCGPVGTGPFVLTLPAPGFLSFTQAGVQDGDVVTYAVETARGEREIGRGTWSATEQQLTRGVVLNSTNGNALLNLVVGCDVGITAAAQDIDLVYNRAANFTVDQQDQARANIGAAAAAISGYYASTLSAAEASKFPGSAQSVTVARFDAASPVMNALYYRVASEPAQTVGKFRSSDRLLPNGDVDAANGGWFQYVLRNGYAHASDFGSGIVSLLRARSVSPNIICADGEDYVFSLPEHVLSYTTENFDILAGKSRWIVGATDARFLTAVRAWEVQQSVSAISGSSVTVANGAVYAPGDIVKIFDETALPSYPLAGKQGEDAVVYSIAGNVLTLTQALVYTYNVATCQLARYRRATQSLHLGDIVNPNKVSHDRLLFWNACVQPKVRIDRVDYVWGMVNYFLSCHEGEARIGWITHGDQSSSYGHVFQNSTGGQASVSGGRVRHLIDGGGSADGATGPSAYGASTGWVGTGMSSGSLSAGFVTHHGAVNVKYKDLVGINCTGVVSSRAVGMVVEDPFFINCTTPVGTFRQYAEGEAVTDNTLILNPVLRDCRSFLSSSGEGSGTVIWDGGSAHLKAGASTTGCMQTNGKLILRGGASFVFDGTTSGRFINTQAGCTGVEMRDAKLLYNSTPPSRLIRNDGGLSLLINVHGLEVVAPGTLTAIYGSSSVLAAGSSFGDIRVPNGLTSPVEGFTWDQVRPYVDGPVMSGYAAFEPVLSRIQQDQSFTGGVRTPSISLGVITTGTVVLDPGDGPKQYLTNNGAFKLEHVAFDGDVDLLVTNGASAGSVDLTFYGSAIGGAALTTTSGHSFRIISSRNNGQSTLSIQARQ